MKINSRVRWLIVLVLMALLTIGGAGVAMAAGAPKAFGHVNLIDKDGIGAAVAERLGINLDELQAAMQSGKDSVQALLDAAGLDHADIKSTVQTEVEAQLAAAVAAGTLTQEKMDAILEHSHGAKGAWGKHSGLHGRQAWATDAIDKQAILQTAAAAVGLDADALQTAMTDGRNTVEALLEANGTTVAEFKGALQTALQQAIDDALEAGTLTEEQAERLNRKGSFGDGASGGRHHGRHGRGGSGIFGARGLQGDNA